MGPRAGLDVYRKPRLHRDSITGPFNLQRVAVPTELLRPTAIPRQLFCSVLNNSFQGALHYCHIRILFDCSWFKQNNVLIRFAAVVKMNMITGTLWFVTNPLPFLSSWKMLVALQLFSCRRNSCLSVQGP